MRLKKSLAKLIAWERVARVATASATGTPHLVPVCHVLADGKLYFASDAGARHRRASGRALGPLRPLEGRRPPRLRLLHRRPQPQGPRAPRERARGRRLLLESPREAGAHRRARRGGLGGGGRRVLGHTAAGEPAGRARLAAERRAREPPLARRALD